MSRFVALIMAAGSSNRMEGQNKLLLPYKEKTVIESVVDQFLACPEIAQVVVVTSNDQVMDRLRDYPVRLIPGGAERSDSVYHGLKFLKPDDFVLIHDGARPFLSQAALKRSIEAAREGSPFVLAVPVTDTLKIVKDSVVVTTPERSDYWAAQTPQGAKVQDLLMAYDEMRQQEIKLTDDASVLERAGYRVRIIQGDYGNRKLTTPEDVRYLCVSDKE